MIDYGKLKIAHEICKKTGYSFSYFFGGLDIPDNCIIYDLGSGPILEDCDNIDELITKLTELTQPKPKYEIGQEIWTGYKSPLKFNVSSNENGKYFVRDDKRAWSTCFSENELYSSRKSLIDAQIKYWTSIKNEEKSTCSENESMISTFEGEVTGLDHSEESSEISECQHKNDGVKWKKYGMGDKVYYECKKCGDFYR